MAPNGSKWLQKALNGSKTFQMAPNGIKMFQTTPNGSKWLQMALYIYKKAAVLYADETCWCASAVFAGVNSSLPLNENTSSGHTSCARMPRVAAYEHIHKNGE